MLKKLIAYNDWAYQKLFDSLMQEATLPPVLLRLLSHTLISHVIWFGRITGTSTTVGVWDEYNLETCMKLYRENALQFEQFKNMSAQELQRIVSYQNTQGLHFESVVEDILIHVLNHSTYHRAQIATVMRESGMTPVGTDYIAFVR